MSFRSSRIGRMARSTGLTIPLLAVLCVLIGSTPAVCIWLPWATDEAKIKKTVADICHALILNDSLTVMQNLTGTGASTFFARQREVILRDKIRDYTCQNYKIQIDPQTGSFAFVEFDKIAAMQGGTARAGTERWVLRKIEGNWLLVTGIKKKDKVPQALRRLKEEALKRFGSDNVAPPADRPPTDEPPAAEVSF